MKRYTIITGNPVDGFEAYGVFNEEIDAITTANGDGDLPEEWWVLTIHPVEKEKS